MEGRAAFWPKALHKPRLALRIPMGIPMGIPIGLPMGDCLQDCLQDSLQAVYKLFKLEGVGVGAFICLLTYVVEQLQELHN